MDLSQFDYHLPPELIATHPAAERSASRLMRVRREGGAFEHAHFSDLPGFLKEGDCLVFNDSKVIPARLHARRPTGGLTELLILEPVGAGVWEAAVRPARKLHTGMRLELPGGAGEAEIVEGGGDRIRHVRFHFRSGVPPSGGAGVQSSGVPPSGGAGVQSSGVPPSGGAGVRDLLDLLEKYGEMPLPPYILHQRREHGEPAAAPEDRERYQTVYAQPPGSVAAPTAGLHFTPEIMNQLSARGIELRRVTLHVGIGTFEPVTAGQIERHKMHSEHYAIGEEDAAAIEAARRAGRRIVAVGTTTVRTLEACFQKYGAIQPARETTDIFIHPGFNFQVAGAMITNFHLPGSTLLMLVAAFAGRERILAAYEEAITQRYRFYSYGDAMLIE